MTPLKDIHTLPATTIECRCWARWPHENHISGEGLNYTARAWYVRKDGKLHGQFATENEAVSFAAALDDPPAAMESGEMLSFEQARAVYLGDFRERHADGNPDSIAAGEQ